jgi:hypothetical protein
MKKRQKIILGDVTNSKATPYLPTPEDETITEMRMTVPTLCEGKSIKNSVLHYEKKDDNRNLASANSEIVSEIMELA